MGGCGPLPVEDRDVDPLLGVDAEEPDENAAIGGWADGGGGGDGDSVDGSIQFCGATATPAPSSLLRFRAGARGGSQQPFLGGSGKWRRMARGASCRRWFRFSCSDPLEDAAFLMENHTWLTQITFGFQETGFLLPPDSEGWRKK